MEKQLKKVFDSLGVRVDIVDIDIKVPLAFRKKYTVKEMDIINETYLLIEENRRGSLENFVKQAEFISREYKRNYILIFKHITIEEKKLLLKTRIPFIDYKGNLFLPQLGLILNKEIEKIQNKKFTPSEQLSFSYIFTNDVRQGKNIEIESIKEKTKLSVATIYRTLRKFVQLGWLQSSHGSYRLSKELSEIFSESQEYLFNPINKKIYIEKTVFQSELENEQVWAYAGTTALSKKSELFEERVIVAISSVEFNKLYKKQHFELYESNLLFKQDLVELQLWEYSPIISNKMVDTLSLYLTLRDSDDPRIEKELYNVMKKEFNITILSEEND